MEMDNVVEGMGNDSEGMSGECGNKVMRVNAGETTDSYAVL